MTPDTVTISTSQIVPIHLSLRLHARQSSVKNHPQNDLQERLSGWLFHVSLKEPQGQIKNQILMMHGPGSWWLTTAFVPLL